ncbi:MAG: tripartite tricarboxylate transporter substrate binding protein [Burkholderiales bacterium]|nr:tripartite tricarboxylate transporter substrate binding protein [Burkholderiales bacterium]
MTHRIGAGLVVGLAALLAAPAALAQAYPNKPVRVLLGYTPGGAADSSMRPLARVLEPILGQPIIIEPRPGAAGGVAAEFISKAAPDGYTLYFADNGPFTTAPHLTKVNYQHLGSFTHIGQTCTSGSILVVHPATPFRSVADVIAAAKKEPDKWSYGTSGVAGPHHLSGEYFKSVTGVSILHVPYKGGAPAMTDLMGGQVPMLFSSLSPVVGPLKAGKLRALAVTSPKRSGAFPDVPTMDEVGVKGFDSTTWFGLVGPAGLPAEVVARLSQALLKAGEDKGLQEQYRQVGCDADFLTPAQTTEKIRGDHAKWGRIIKDANIRAE